jgi:hydrogenase-4 component E
MMTPIDFVMILFGAVLLNVTVSSRLEVYIRTIFLQGILLFVAALFSLPGGDRIDIAVLAAETLGFKALVTPWYLRRVIRENGIYRETEPNIANFYSLVAGSALFIFGVAISYWAQGNLQPIRPLHFGMSISAILIGLFIVLTRKKLVTHVMGYIIMENGIFLLSLAVAPTMPGIVELGVALDVFVGVFVFGVFIKRIRTLLDEHQVDSLTDLRD